MADSAMVSAIFVHKKSRNFSSSIFYGNLFTSPKRSMYNEKKNYFNNYMRNPM